MEAGAMPVASKGFFFLFFRCGAVDPLMNLAVLWDALPLPNCAAWLLLHHMCWSHVSAAVNA